MPTLGSGFLLLRSLSTRRRAAASVLRVSGWSAAFLCAFVVFARGVAASDAGPESFESASATTIADPGRWIEHAPPQRVSGVGVYDATRHRLLVIGGSDGGYAARLDLWALTLATMRWEHVPTAGSPPPNLYGTAGIYDAARDRVVVFGVMTGPYSASNATWALDLSGTPTWSMLAPSGAPPPPRVECSVVYDAAGARMIVYGGSTTPFGGSALGDVWALSLEAPVQWTELSPSGAAPPARYAHTAVIDPVHHRMIVHGGCDYAAPYRHDTWLLSLDDAPTWSEVQTATSPPGRCSHTAVFDPESERMLAILGDGSYDIWQLALAGTPSWSPLTIPGFSGERRLDAVAVYDPVGRRAVVHGGSGLHGTLGSTRAVSFVDPPQWSDLSPGSSPPGARMLHSVIQDARGRMVVFGGRLGGAQDVADVWALDLADSYTWSEWTPSGAAPAARFDHSAVYDAERDRMIVFGGSTSFTRVNDVWALGLAEPAAWSLLSPMGEGPSPLSRHAAIVDPVRQRMIVFGGVAGWYPEIPSDSVWSLSLVPPMTWSRLQPITSGPGPSGFASAVYDPVRDRMIVLRRTGGYIYPDSLEVWALALADPPLWSRLVCQGDPGVNGLDRIVYDSRRDRIVMLGTLGYYGTGTGAPWALDLGTNAWTQLAPEGGRPAPRVGHSALHDAARDRIVVFGGYVSINDTWSLSFDTTTPVLVQNVETRTEPDRVEVRWWLSQSGAQSVEVWRRRGGEPWRFAATIAPDPGGFIIHVDRSVLPGERLAYRLRLPGAAELWSNEVDVVVPPWPGFYLAVSSAPVTGALAALIELPSASEARLELFDIGGRRVASRAVGHLGRGRHRIELGPASSISPGLYWLRLTQAGRSLHAHAVVLH
jgi:hypothetical protein